MEANPILFQRFLQRQTHFALELFNDKVDSAPHRRTPRLPFTVAHLALPRCRTPNHTLNQWLRGRYMGGIVDRLQEERRGLAGRGTKKEK
ncbi:hypothetical protein ACFX15_016170 [Malus domestica]